MVVTGPTLELSILSSPRSFHTRSRFRFGREDSAWNPWSSGGRTERRVAVPWPSWLEQCGNTPGSGGWKPRSPVCSRLGQVTPLHYKPSNRFTGPCTLRSVVTDIYMCTAAPIRDDYLSNCCLNVEQTTRASFWYEPSFCSPLWTRLFCPYKTRSVPVTNRFYRIISHSGKPSSLDDFNRGRLICVYCMRYLFTSSRTQTLKTNLLTLTQYPLVLFRLIVLNPLGQPHPGERNSTDTNVVMVTHPVGTGNTHAGPSIKKR
jgi:hypothetical protein